MITISSVWLFMKKNLQGMMGIKHNSFSMIVFCKGYLDSLKEIDILFGLNMGYGVYFLFISWKWVECQHNVLMK